MSQNQLRHIAFIMDGNRRWARNKGLPVFAGHKKGAEVLRDTILAAKDFGVDFVTVYAFSTENWRRGEKEVADLMNLLREYLNSGFNELDKQNVRILFIGERYMLAPDIVEKMQKIEDKSSNNDGITLCVALSYGSRAEIVSAIKCVSQKVKSGELNLDDIDEKCVSSHLYTKDIPDPDLLIRTSGEIRISNYLLWQLAYSEFYFTDTLWPDFSKDELETIINKYKKRERRYGKS